MSVEPHNPASGSLMRPQSVSSDDRGNSPLDDLQRALDQMRLFASPDRGESPATARQAARQEDAKIANIVAGSMPSFFDDLSLWGEKGRQAVVLREGSLDESELLTQQGPLSASPLEQAAASLATDVIGRRVKHTRVVASYDEMEAIKTEVSLCRSADEAYGSDPLCLEFEMLKVWTQRETSDTYRIQAVCFGIMIALQSMPQSCSFLNCACQSCQYFRESMKSTMSLVDERCGRPTDSVMNSELQKRDTERLRWFDEKFSKMVDAHLPISDPGLQGYRNRILPFEEELAAIIQKRKREPARHPFDTSSMGKVEISREQQRFEMWKIWASREAYDTCRMQQAYFNIFGAQKRVPFPRDLFNPIHPLSNRFNDLLSRLKQLIDERRERLTDSVMDSVLQKNDTGRLRWIERKYSELVEEQFGSSNGCDLASEQIRAQVLAPVGLVELLERRTIQEPID